MDGYDNKKRVTDWIKLISITGSAQITIQLISLLCGIIIIRLLSSEEYALYTIANAMLGTIVTLADGGVIIGLQSQGGQVWQNREKLGSVVVTALSMRRKFAPIVLLINLPILVYLLLHHHASVFETLVITLSVIPSFLLTLSTSIYETTLYLHQDVKHVQGIQVKVNALRVIFLSCVIFIFPFAALALLSGTFGQIWGNIKQKKRVLNFAAMDLKPDPIVRNNIFKVVKRILPTDIYSSFSGQINIWLISFFGATTAIAQIGAIGRLAATLNVVIILTSTLISPRFARLNVDHSTLKKRFLQIVSGMFLFCVFIVGFFWMFATEALWILGSKYSGLEDEVLLNIIATCIYILSSTCFALAASRGWAVNPIASITLNLFSVLIGITLVDISSLKGILLFNILLASLQFLVGFCFGLKKLNTSRLK